MDRLARSLRDLRDVVDEIVAKGASVEFIKEQQTYGPGGDDALGQLMLHLLGAFAEFERSLIRERQADGIRIAKAAGKYTGWQRRLDADQVAAARADIAAGVPKAAVARKLGVDRTTLYRALALPSPTSSSRPRSRAASERLLAEPLESCVHRICPLQAGGDRADQALEAGAEEAVPVGRLDLLMRRHHHEPPVEQHLPDLDREGLHLLQPEAVLRRTIRSLATSTPERSCCSRLSSASARMRSIAF
ncbi:recombinase family protein [Rathayibacter sp. VKM Ac-2759]|uniref:recombinase family protein n=1 Tax=Rathayibacter sp. VKM Ac-2759 TaxID=2609252 RepID=UPI001FC97DAD|nr:recombinase family protein [Rathayibacter sp. VKM Ac-2759]